MAHPNAESWNDRTKEEEVHWNEGILEVGVGMSTEGIRKFPR